MVVPQCEAEPCHSKNKKLGRYLPCQGNNEGLYHQNMTVAGISFELISRL